MVKLAEKARFDGAQLIFEEGNTTDSYDAGFLISTLLIFVAKGDGQISHLESGKMIELLSSRLETHNAVALGRLSGAIMFLASDTKVAQTLREISDGLSPAEKDEVFNMVLKLKPSISLVRFLAYPRTLFTRSLERVLPKISGHSVTLKVN